MTDKPLTQGTKVKVDHQGSPAINDFGYVQGSYGPGEGPVEVLLVGDTKTHKVPRDWVSVPDILSNDLTVQVIAAAIVAAEDAITSAEQFGARVGDVDRPTAIAGVVAHALAWFEMDHGEAWNRAEWTKSAEGAIEYAQEQAASIVPMAWPKDIGPGIHWAD